MHLSTSSSSQRAPALPWRCVLILAAILATAGLGAWETLWRSVGFIPTVRDTPSWWAVHRSNDALTQPSTVVLIGSSRIQMDIDPRILRDDLGTSSVVQLGITGSSPMPVLRDLAADPTFRGRVLCEVIPSVLFGPAPEEDDRAREFLAKLRGRAWVADIEAKLRAEMQQRVTTVQDGLQLDSLPWKILSQKQLPKPMPDEWMREDRYLPGYFAGRDDLAYLTENWRRTFAKLDTPYNDEQLDTRIGELSEIVEKIRSRGGDVVFVRMPSSGPVREVEEANFPRQLYWDRFAASSMAPTLQVFDEPTLSGFQCAEGSHLDVSDVPAFTRALAGLLPAHWRVGDIRARWLQGDDTDGLSSRTRSRSHPDSALDGSTLSHRSNPDNPGYAL